MVCGETQKSSISNIQYSIFKEAERSTKNHQPSTTHQFLELLEDFLHPANLGMEALGFLDVGDGRGEQGAIAKGDALDECLVDHASQG